MVGLGGRGLRVPFGFVEQYDKISSQSTIGLCGGPAFQKLYSCDVLRVFGIKLLLQASTWEAMDRTLNPKP